MQGGSEQIQRCAKIQVFTGLVANLCCYVFSVSVQI